MSLLLFVLFLGMNGERDGRLQQDDLGFLRRTFDRKGIEGR